MPVDKTKVDARRIPRMNDVEIDYTDALMNRIDKTVEEIGYISFVNDVFSLKERYVCTVGRHVRSLRDGLDKRMDIVAVGSQMSFLGKMVNDTIQHGRDNQPDNIYQLPRFGEMRFKLEAITHPSELTRPLIGIYLLLNEYQVKSGFNNVPINFRQIIFSDKNGKFKGQQGCKYDFVKHQYPV